MSIWMVKKVEIALDSCVINNFISCYTWKRWEIYSLTFNTKLYYRPTNSIIRAIQNTKTPIQLKLIQKTFHKSLVKKYKNQILYMLVASCLTFAFTFGLALYDYQVKKKQQQRQEETKQKKRNFQTIKILLTGGPCGGKSEGINCIYHSFISIAAPVFIVPEAATIIGTAGLTLDLSQFKPRQIQLFQIYLMRLQYNLQENVLNIATNLQKLEKTPIVLCDRGLLDGKAYAGEQNWAKMLKQIGITEKDILNRYKAAIHMVTAAKGAEHYYNYTNDQRQIKEVDNSGECNQGLKVRKESPQLAVDLDQRIQRCYKDHPNRYIISNEFFVKNFEDKKTVLLAQVYQILSQIIKRNDLSQYYSDYESTRKNSEENINLLDHPSPYLIRKKKFQKFLRSSKSPLRTSQRKLRQLIEPN